ncbi:MAG: glycosyltransferase family 4 protein [Nitrospirae bacterium]|nr:glycosyltransferase family 4 protein [Nitrospirota bacterium]MBF0618427.1 glycosyltransferase family 4 protein [Nitrospirota bacterium]
MPQINAMTKHYVIISDAVPHCYHGGGGITAYAAALSLLAAGNSVSVLALGNTGYTGNRPENEHIAQLTAKGIDVTVLPDEPTLKKPAGLFDKLRMHVPIIETLFSGGYAKRALVREYLEGKSPDGVFMYHWGPIASAYGLRKFRKVGVVGDPVHMPVLLRMNFEKLYGAKKGLKELVIDRLTRFKLKFTVEAMKRLLMDCDVSGAFAAQEADMFRGVGVKRCEYFRTPVMDPLPYHKAVAKPEKFKILHIGHLKGIATLMGVDLLAKEVLPALSTLLPEGSYEVHIVGGFFDSVPERLKQSLRSDPHVLVRGYVDSAEEEFLSSQVVIVPTPVVLGIRVRIINAFSLGCAVVSHKANKAGIPELEHGYNCLLGGDGMELAKQCAALYNDPVLMSKLQKNARDTYEKSFSTESAGGFIVRAMEG